MSARQPTRLLSGLIPAISQRPSDPQVSGQPARHLIAIRTKGGIICVRNVHRVNRGLVVENIGSALGLREIDQPIRFVINHAIVHEPPFSIRVPQSNFMRDLTPQDYEGAMQAAESMKETKWTRDEVEKQETPFQVLLENWWSDIGMWRPWTAARISLLAAGLSVTLSELAQLVGCTWGELTGAMNSDGERGFSKAQRLWLFYYEQFVQWVRFGRRPDSMFPENLLAAHPKGRTGRYKFMARAGADSLNAAVAAKLE